MNKTLIAILLVLTGIIGTILGLLNVKQVQKELVFAGVVTNQEANIQGRFTLYSFFASTTPSGALVGDATTTSATSTTIVDINAARTDGIIDKGFMDIRGAKKVQLWFASSGSARFKIDGSYNGTEWTNLNRLLGDDVSLTATSTFTISSGTTTVSLDLTNKTFHSIRCVVNSLSSGGHSCFGQATW